MAEILTYCGYYEAGRGWWIPSLKTNALFFVDEDESSKYVNLFECEGEQQNVIITRTLLHENKLYFFSRYSYEFWTMEKETEEFEYTKIRDTKEIFITNVEMVGDSIWLFPNSFNEPIVKYNIKQSTYKEIEWKCNAELGSSSITRTIICGDCILFTNRVGKNIHLFKLNMVTDDMEIQYLPQVDYINCIAADLDNVWILYRRNESTYIGNIGSLSNKEFDVSEMIMLNYSPVMSYFKMINFEHELILFSCMKNEIVKISKESGKCCRIELYEGNIFDDKESRQNEIQLIGDELIIYSPSMSLVNIINIDSMEQRHVDLEIDEVESMKYIKDITAKGNVHIENRFDNLSRFIKSI